MRIVQVVRSAAAAAVLLLAVPLAAGPPAALAAVLPAAAGAATTTDPLEVISQEMAAHPVYLAPGYDGKTVDVAQLTAAINAGSASIRIVGVPQSVADRYSDPKTMPLTLRSDAGFNGDVAVLTLRGFYATNSIAVSNALAGGGSATEIVEAYVRAVQATQAGTAQTGTVQTGTTGQPGSGSSIGTIVVVLVLVALAVWVLLRSRRRRRPGALTGGGAEDLESLRRRGRADLSVLQAEYNDHAGTDASVQGVIDAAGELLTGATTAADVAAAERMINGARNQLNPGRVPPEPVAIAAAPAAGTVDGGQDGQGYVVNRQGQVQQYAGRVPRGYQVVPPQYYGSITGSTITDLVVLQALFSGGGGLFGGGGWGGGGGFFGGGGGGWGGGGGQGGPPDGGGGNWGGGGGGGDSGGGNWGGGGDSGGGGGGGGGDSGGGNW